MNESKYLLNLICF